MYSWNIFCCVDYTIILSLFILLSDYFGFGHWELFKVASYELLTWSHPSLNTFLFSGTNICFLLILYFFCPRPGINSISLVPFIENAIYIHNLGVIYANWMWVRGVLLILSLLSGQNQQIRVCILTHRNLYLLLCLAMPVYLSFQSNICLFTTHWQPLFYNCLMHSNTMHFRPHKTML